MRLRVAQAVCLSMCGLALAACGDDDESGKVAKIPTSLEEACEGGAEEGTVTIWGGSDEEVVRGQFDEFSKTHPGMKLEYLAIRPSDGAQRLVTEDAADKAPEVDVVSFDPDALSTLINRDMVPQDVDWAALGVSESLVTSQNSVLWTRNPSGITYNTDLVAPEEVPTTWEDLLDPRWKGQVVVDPRGRPFDKFVLTWGEEATLEYVEKLAANEPIIIEGGTAGMVAVGSGEAAITAGGLVRETKEQQAENAPVEFAYLDASSSEDDLLNVMTKAKHPNAGYCFSAWAGSEEGQAVALELTLSNAEITGSPDGLEVRVIETPEEAELVAEISAKIAEIWTGQ
jgi:iron(III) transport system substrate-binding protein